MKRTLPRTEIPREDIHRTTTIDDLNAQTIEQIKTFTHGMFDINVGPALSLTKLFDFSKYSKLIDIGGFSAGVYAIRAVEAYPSLSADVIISLEPVAQIANGYIKQFNLEHKVSTRVFNVFEEFTTREGEEEVIGQEIKKSNNNYDVAIVSNILHRGNEEKNKLLLKRIYKSLIPGKANENNKNDSKNATSVIIISEWLLDAQKTGPISSALMNLNMILESSEGRTYSFAEVSDMLRSVGFANIQKIEARGPTDFVVGYKTQG